MADITATVTVADVTVSSPSVTVNNATGVNAPLTTPSISVSAVDIAEVVLGPNSDVGTTQLLLEINDVSVKVNSSVTCSTSALTMTSVALAGVTVTLKALPLKPQHIGKRAISITPDNANELPIVISQLCVGGAGNVAVIFEEDTAAVTITGLVAGQIIQGRIRQVKATGTTATALVGIS